MEIAISQNLYFQYRNNLQMFITILYCENSISSLHIQILDSRKTKLYDNIFCAKNKTAETIFLKEK